MTRYAAALSRPAPSPRVTLAGLLAIGLIAGIYVLKAPAILLATLALALIVCGAVLLVRRRLDSIALLVGLNCVYWLASGIFVGTFHVADLTAPNFYDRDGRIFICYLPFLFFSVLSARRTDCEAVASFLKLLTLVSGPLYLLWLATGTSLLSGSRERHFFGFLTSHTGAGTFFGFLAVFLLLYGAEVRSRWTVLLGLCALPPVDGAASRATAVSLLAVAVWYLALKRNWRAFVLGGAALLALLLLLSGFDANVFVRMEKVFQLELWQEIARMSADTRWEPGQERKAGGEDFNVVSRILFFLYALRMFLASPLLGFGFGRYGDHNMSFVGEPGWLWFAPGGEPTEVWHAHNSYLHMLAETGLLGLLLLLVFWAALYRRLSALSGAEDGRFRAYALACRGLVVYAFVAALFGHTLASPSLILPLAACAGLALAASRDRPGAANRAADSRFAAPSRRS